MEFTATDAITLLDALAMMFPDSSRSSLRSWIKTERVVVDGRTAKAGNLVLEAGQVVQLLPKKRIIEGGVEILYEDRDIVVINKPCGLVSVKTDYNTTNTAHAILKRHYKPLTVHVVHRLDQDTSGVMLFALNEKAHTALKKIFEIHDIDRRYCAIVEGPMKTRKGTWSSHLYEDGNYVVHETEDQQKGRLSVTHYTVVSKSKKHTWLDLCLETGRKNQIRVHCQNAGHPVSGDRKYGAQDTPAKRLCLHAYALGFAHPETGKKMYFESPAPQVFYKIVSKKGDVS